MEREPDNTKGNPDDGGAASADGGGFSRRFVEGLLPDMMRKTASGALSTVMLTEEVVRTVLGAASRELMQYAREQVDKGKADIVALVTRELQEHLRDMDIAEEMERILQRMDVEVSATVRFVPRGGGAGLAPDVNVETRVSAEESDLETTAPAKPSRAKAPRKKASQAKKSPRKRTSAPRKRAGKATSRKKDAPAS